MNLTPRVCPHCESIALPYEVKKWQNYGDSFHNLSCGFQCVHCGAVCGVIRKFESNELAQDAKVFVMSFGFADGDADRSLAELLQIEWYEENYFMRLDGSEPEFGDVPDGLRAFVK